MTPDAAWLHAAALGLGAGALLALAVWAASVPKRDVSIVDVAFKPRDSSHFGHTAFSEADIEVNARCLLLRGRGNRITARPHTQMMKVFMRFLDPLRAMA